MTTEKALEGKPYAGNPHAWFDGWKLPGLIVLTVAMAASMIAAGEVRADAFYWNASGSGGWGDAGRWFQGDESTPASRPPAADDTVNVAGCEAAVSDGDQSTINAISGIVLSDSAASVAFENENDFTLGCTVSGAGTLKKRGGGKLFLAALGRIKAGDGQTANNCLSDHNPDGGIVIEEGWIVAPQSSGKGRHLCLKMEVQENGVFQMINDNVQVFGNVTGTGTITNAVPTTTYQTIWFGRRYNSDKFHFAGKLAGTKWSCTTWGHLKLTGVNSTVDGNQIGCSFNDGALNKGTVSIVKFGKGSEPSSVGTIGKIAMTYSGRMEYLGSGEVTDKSFIYRAQRSARNVFDAGAHGGLVFSNAIEQIDAADCRAMARVELTGSNAVPCVIAGGWMQNAQENGTNYATYVTKTGKGTWRIADNKDNKQLGAFAVQEGTLQYDSILEAGTVSALGLSTVLYKDIGDVKRLDENKVDYAVLLGGPTTNVVFEYTGSGTSATSSRRIALTGTESRIRASSGSVALLGGTYSLDAGEKTLILDGVSNKASIGNISNGVGKVSVVKDGSGTWTLKRDLTFSGGLEVRGGTLVVSRAKEPYTWYRFTAMEGLTSYFAYLSEIALYDESGKLCCTNLAWRAPSSFDGSANKSCANDVDYHTLQPGEVCFGDGKSRWCYTGAGLEKLFNGTSGQWRTYVGWDTTTPENTYIPIVFRPPADANPARAFDVYTMPWDSNHIKRFKMEASVDGVQWDLIADVSVNSIGNGRWYSDLSDDSVADHVPDVAAHPEFGFENGKFYDSSTLSNVAHVAVSGGATLRAEGDVTLPAALNVDCSKGGGTVEGFVIPENGTVAVTGLDDFGSCSVELPIRLVGCTDSANISRWSVTVSADGHIYRKARVACRADGTLSLIPSGMMLIVY